MMRRFFINLSIFILGLNLFIILPILILSSFDNNDKETSSNHNIISLQTCSNYDKLDILFVGNSYCYSSVNTVILDSCNIRSFNLGISTAGVAFYELILNDYLEHSSVPPKLVMILVSPTTFSNKSDNFIAYPIHRYLKDGKSNLWVAFKYNRFDDIFSMYKRSLEKGIEHLYQPSEGRSDTERYNNKGFYPSSEIYNTNKQKDNESRYLSLKGSIFSQWKIKKLITIANSLKKAGSTVIFFEVPTNDLKKYYSRSYLASYEAAKLRLKDQYDLISVDGKLFKPENFRNIDHMNSSGATIATKEIVKLLRNRYLKSYIY